MTVTIHPDGAVRWDTSGRRVWCIVTTMRKLIRWFLGQRIYNAFLSSKRGVQTQSLSSHPQSGLDETLPIKNDYECADECYGVAQASIDSTQRVENQSPRLGYGLSASAEQLGMPESIGEAIEAYKSSPHYRPPSVITIGGRQVEIFCGHQLWPERYSP